MRQISAQLVASSQFAAARERAAIWLRSGLEPRQLAFTLALGFAIGCIPLLGITTGICALLALLFGLNMPAIQAANWVAMPFQAALLVPFLRLGQWMIPGNRHGVEAELRAVFTPSRMIAHFVTAPLHAIEQLGSILGRALLAWGVTALPTLLLLTLLLTPVLHRMRLRTAAEKEPSED
ncbi:MAG TPA: DUF2062 domain-containing protein [Acidobacteriaceae bacterium]|nr:DUF2062 domain-containing protein [Acidobacteriaceae bacterium]